MQFFHEKQHECYFWICPLLRAFKSQEKQGRKGISAGLEQQEISNQKKAADGEKQMQQELRSIEVSALNEEANAFNRREKREDATIGRLEEKEDFYTQQEVAYGDAATEALVGTVSNVGSAVAGNMSGTSTVF